MGYDIDHIAIAVKDLKKSAAWWKNLFGLKKTGSEKIAVRGADLVSLSSGKEPVFELLAPLGDNSPVSKFLETRGEGIHHICFKVPDIEKSMRELKEKGLKFIQEQPVAGAEGSRIVFIHPSGLNGVLIELKEKPEPIAKT